MREVELSTMVSGDCLDLKSLEEKWFLKVNHKQYDWATGWNNILQIGLYQKGPEASEIGSTWLENLNDMRALRPFSISEINSLGGEDAFLSNAWGKPASPNTASLNRTPARPTSIPWVLDTRIISYRRDLFDRARVNPSIAFDTPEAFYEMLCRLRETGIQYPLVMATGGLSVHNLATWVWGRGGHFRSEDFRRITLVEPAALQGMYDFFRLHEFIDPATRGMNYSSTDELYLAGKGALLLGGSWVMKIIKSKDNRASAEVRQNTGFAIPPGIPYLGATHLVIWRHTLHDQEALQAIGHLVSPEVLWRVFKETGNFPARISALDGEAFISDPDYRLAAECLKRGRAFRSSRLWAGVEMRLNTLCDQLWIDLFANPSLDLRGEIERRVGELATRLEKTLLANW